MGFQFSAPKTAPGLSQKLASSIRLAAIAGKLAVEERTAVYNTDGRPENVAEHSLMLAIVAPALAEEYFPELNADRVARYAAIHDIVEAYCGDTPTHIISTEELKQKVKLEKLALTKLKLDYANLPNFVTRVSEYEAQKTPEARFVRVVDKLMPLLVHVNDNGAGLKRARFTPDQIRQNVARVEVRLSAEYPELSSLVELRAELAEYVAKRLEE